MERQILMSSFNLCPRMGYPVIGNECLECEYINSVDDDHFCLYDEETMGHEIRIVDLIGFLAQLLENGKNRIGLDELSQLFMNEEDDS
ncbi:MAG: hypothetical protein ABRQ26_09060 [Syntrophomonadaceae bacterium]